jgi:membrane protease YdiL (CAAX protease family)
MKQALLGNLTPFSRLIFIVALTFSCFIITFFLALLLALPVYHVNLKDILEILNQEYNTTAIALLKYFQVTQSIGLFIIPAFLAGYFFERNSLRYLHADRTSNSGIFLIAFLLMFVSLPFINWLVSVNEMMKLPGYLKGLEDWMKNAEDQAGKLTDTFLRGKSFGNFLFNIFMIGILPAIGEEFMFRGILQRLLKEWLKNIHVAIFITGFLFGAMHMQFYGLLPRMILGVIFGYLFYWSGSIWVPVFAHFINNSGAIVVSWLSNIGLISQKYQDFGSTGNMVFIILSFLMTVSCLFMVYRRKPVIS